MLEKEFVIDAIDKMPERFEIDELVEKLIIINKIQNGLNDYNSGRVFNEAEVEQRLSKWLE